MSIGSDLFWYRARHWRFIWPVAGLLWIVTAFILYIGQNSNDSIGVVSGALFLLASSIYVDFDGFPPKKLDEREQRGIEIDNSAYLGPIAVLSVFGVGWFSFSGSFPTIWLPKTPEDWRAILWLLLGVGVASKMISQRLRALPPLDEEELDPA
jgi:hypothetical protein